MGTAGAVLTAIIQSPEWTVEPDHNRWPDSDVKGQHLGIDPRPASEKRMTLRPLAGVAVGSPVISAVSEHDLSNLVAPGKGPNALQQQGLIELKLLPDHRVVDRHDQASVPFDPGRVSELLVGFADDLAPGIANGVLRGRHPDSVFAHKIADQVIDTPDRSHPRPAGVLGQTSEIRDQVFDPAAERFGGRHRV